MSTTDTTLDLLEVRRQVRQALGILKSIDERMTDAVQVSDKRTPKIADLDSPEAWKRFYRFLRRIQLEGPEGLDVDRQRELMLAEGYNPQASGGFFKGQNASMRRDKATDQRYLTDEGVRLIEVGRGRFGSDIEP
jgi:hypothetical protein